MIYLVWPSVAFGFFAVDPPPGAGGDWLPKWRHGPALAQIDIGRE